MSAASPARSPARDAAPASAPAAKPKRSGFSFAAGDSQDEFKLNLSDIPKLPYSMDVEGFKPSLLVRLVGLVVKPK